MFLSNWLNIGRWIESPVKLIPLSNDVQHFVFVETVTNLIVVLFFWWHTGSLILFWFLWWGNTVTHFFNWAFLTLRLNLRLFLKFFSLLPFAVFFISWHLTSRKGIFFFFFWALGTVSNYHSCPLPFNFLPYLVFRGCTLLISKSWYMGKSEPFWMRFKNLGCRELAARSAAGRQPVAYRTLRNEDTLCCGPHVFILFFFRFLFAV